jgi:hypothetical protein
MEKTRVNAVEVHESTERRCFVRLDRPVKAAVRLVCEVDARAAAAPDSIAPARSTADCSKASGSTRRSNVGPIPSTVDLRRGMACSVSLARAFPRPSHPRPLGAARRSHPGSGHRRGDGKVRSRCARTAAVWIAGLPTAGRSPLASVPGSAWCTPYASGGFHHGGVRRPGAPAGRAGGGPACRSRTTTVYDRLRQDRNRQAAYVVVAFVRGA